MDKDLMQQALAKLVSGIVTVALLTFVPAGTLAWRNAWLLMGVLFVPMIAAGFVMLYRTPDLLRSRLNAREEQGDQRTVIAASGLMFVAAFVIAGLGHRFGWASFPWAVSVGAAVAFLAGYALFGEVLRENAYLSRTVEVQEGQHVVDTGLYGIVRHPMYAATLLMFLAMPVILGLPFATAILLCYLPIIQKRMEGEERVLAEELPGYADYLQRVRWRVIPHLW